MASSNHTLRSTLTLWLEFACGLGLLVLCAGLGLVRRASYHREQDDALVSDASKQVARLLAQAEVRSPDEWLRGSLVTGVDGSCALRAEDGQILASSNVERAELLPPIPSSPAAACTEPSRTTAE